MITWVYGLSPTPPTPAPSVGGGALAVVSTGLDLADLALDPATGDLFLPPTIIRGAAAVAQRVRVRFRWFLGEWYLDQRLGIPYFRDILIKNPDPILISFIFRRVLTTTPGIARVASLSASLDKPSRQLTVDFEAQLSDGATLTAQAEPFIIDG